jgi:sRNA-binding protein
MLVKAYPAFRDRRLPLALGVYDDLAARHPDVDTRALRRVLVWWTHSPVYRRALAREGSVRHGLDGTPCGPVSEEHRAQARAALAS